jgi:lipoprotein NlpI
MKTILLASMVWAAAAGAAAASAYGDFNAAISSRSDRNIADAIKFMDRALAAPDLPAHLRPTALRVRAQAYAEAKQYDLAAADFGSALALRPADYDTLLERGVLYGTVKKYDLARADFSAAIRLRPELDRAYVAQAATFLAEEKFDDAIRNYDDALRTSPDEVDLMLLRGEANRLARRFDAAIADYTAAIRRDSQYSTAHSLRALAHLEAGDLRAAVSDYEDAVDLEPNDPDLRAAAGAAEWVYGDYRRAEREFEKSGRDPRYALLAQLWLHLAALKRGRSDDGFSARAAKLDLKPWPGPLLGFYAGTASADEVLAAAKLGEPETQKDQLCEADFFLAEWHIDRKEETAARPLLEDAVTACRRGLPETYAASTELGKLKP